MAITAPTYWQPRRSSGGDAALWASAGVALVSAVALGLALAQEPGLGMLALVVVAAILGLAALGLLAWALAYRRLGYALTEEGLTVEWLGETLVVPYQAIDGIYTGQRLVGHARPSVPAWPGIYVGPGRARGTGRLRFYATSQDPADLTLVTVGSLGIVVSARDPQAFRSALIQRVQRLGEPVASGDVAVSPASQAPWSALHDRWAPWTLAAALLLLFLALALIALRYPGLPEVVPLHFDASGQPNEMGDRADLLRLPLGGALVLALNWLLGVWLHPRAQRLVRVLWVATATIQAILLVAVVRLLQ